MSNISIDLLNNAELEEIYSGAEGDYRNIYKVMHNLKFNAEDSCIPLKAGYDDDKYLLDFLEDYEEYLIRTLKQLELKT